MRPGGRPGPWLHSVGIALPLVHQRAATLKKIYRRSGTVSRQAVCTLADNVLRGWGTVPEVSEQFRKRAAECYVWGKTALTERARDTWLSMAQLWLQLTERSEQD